MPVDQILAEPLPCQIGDLLERSALLEQMARARNDLEPAYTAEPAKRIVIEIYHDGVEASHDE